MYGIWNYSVQIILLSILQLCISDTIDISFTETKMFVDISEYTFDYDWMNVSQDFSITARDNRQVSLYIISSPNDNNYTLNVFDGANDSFPAITTMIAKPDNNTLLIVPLNISSTGRSMFLRVSSVGDYPGFYAIVTDYVRQDGCLPPVMSIPNFKKLQAHYNFEQNKNNDCYYMMRASQQVMTNRFTLIPDNQPLSKISVYKGLQTDDKHLLQTTDQMSYLWAFDQYLVIHPKETVSMQFGLDQLDGFDNTLQVTRGIQNSIMTVDYLYGTGQFFDGEMRNIIVLALQPPVTLVEITYWNLMGSSSLIVTPVKNGSPVSKPITYLSSEVKTPFNVTYSCEEVHLIYKATGLTANSTSGLYGMYRDATIYVEKTTTSPVQTKGNYRNTLITIIIASFVKYIV